MLFASSCTVNIRVQCLQNSLMSMFRFKCVYYKSNLTHNLNLETQKESFYLMINFFKALKFLNVC